MIQLFEHNRVAYERVCELLEEGGKAAVIHPTGTGKSFIAFKLAEDHPDQSFLWLSPSEKIYATQLENVRNASGFAPLNITFLTYARLTARLKETDFGEPLFQYWSDLQPDVPRPTGFGYIILDEFHRAGAPEWGRSVRKLIAANPEAKLLGLSATNIRYLDNRRDMAAELFGNAIASEMSLTQAVTQNILPAPKYVISLYGCNPTRIPKSTAAVPRGRLFYGPCSAGPEEPSLTDLRIQKLRRALSKAQNLETIFPRHMFNPHGKYLVFCAGYHHMQQMMRKSHSWFSKVDPCPRFYSLWSESPTADQEYIAFKNDSSDHLRLLFCIDMLNEGVHVEGLSGVILFRPTVSPIIYKQQIGRALSALEGNITQPVIFDVVNNFEHLFPETEDRWTARDWLNEPTVFLKSVFNRSGETALDVPPFEVIDETRDCRRLFRDLENDLAQARESEKQKVPDPFELGLQAARAYYEHHGDLEMKHNYVTEDGFPLGRWLKNLRWRKKYEIVSPETIRKYSQLNEFGMRWTGDNNSAWESFYGLAKRYYKANRHLDPPARYKMDQLCLGKWLARQRENYRDGRLTPDQISRLELLGMNWIPVSRR